MEASERRIGREFLKNSENLQEFGGLLGLSNAKRSNIEILVIRRYV